MIPERLYILFIALLNTHRHLYKWCTALNVASDVDSTMRFVTGIDTANGSATFLSPRTTSGVTKIIILPALNNKGIQKGRVFPEPVGARVTKSCWASWANAALSCHLHGKKPNQSFTAIHIASRDGRSPVGGCLSSSGTEESKNEGKRPHALCTHACIHKYSINLFHTIPKTDMHIYNYKCPNCNEMWWKDCVVSHPRKCWHKCSQSVWSIMRSKFGYRRKLIVGNFQHTWFRASYMEHQIG